MSDSGNDSSSVNPAQRRDDAAMSDGSSNDNSSNNHAQRRHCVLRQRFVAHQSLHSQRLGGYQSPHRWPFFATSSVAHATSPPDLPELMAFGSHAATAVRSICASSPGASPLTRISLRAERVEKAKADKVAAHRAPPEDARRAFLLFGFSAWFCCYF